MVSASPSSLLSSNEDPRPDKRSALVIRNVSVHGHRTSIRLEPQIWDSMTEICRSEFCTPHDVCSYVAERKPAHGSLTSSLRVFILDYFRKSSTQDGHRSAGHGQGMFISQQQERMEMRKLKADAVERPDGLSRSPQRTRSGPGAA
jgi:predicted DNA-binding ribbon-helix-helix protein